MKSDYEIYEKVKLLLNEMLNARYYYTLKSHVRFSDASTLPFIGLIKLMLIKSDRKKYYRSFQIHLKQLCDKFNISQKEIKNFLVELLDENSLRDDGSEQIIINVLYELGYSKNKQSSKSAHNRDYALNPKKVAKIWDADWKLSAKDEAFLNNYPL